MGTNLKSQNCSNNLGLDKSLFAGTTAIQPTLFKAQFEDSREIIANGSVERVLLTANERKVVGKYRKELDIEPMQGEKYNLVLQLACKRISRHFSNP